MAYDYIYGSMDHGFESFNVYTDADAGSNHFIPSVVFADWPFTPAPFSQGATCWYINTEEDVNLF